VHCLPPPPGPHTHTLPCDCRCRGFEYGVAGWLAGSLYCIAKLTLLLALGWGSSSELLVMWLQALHAGGCTGQRGGGKGGGGNLRLPASYFACLWVAANTVRREVPATLTCVIASLARSGCPACCTCRGPNPPGPTPPLPTPLLRSGHKTINHPSPNVPPPAAPT
jgi:hypothetical protein